MTREWITLALVMASLVMLGSIWLPASWPRARALLAVALVLAVLGFGHFVFSEYVRAGRCERAGGVYAGQMQCFPESTRITIEP